MDSSNSSLKGVLLHNGNKLPSVPIVFSIHLKETYENVKFILEQINYKKHNWRLCGDFKIISITLGQQAGYTRYPCFLCNWNSRADSQHWTNMEWSKRETLEKGDANVNEEPLIDRYRVLLPPLHIKLGLMKQFVKALNQTNKSYIYIKSKFPGLSDAKIKAGVFNGPQIRNLMQDEKFANCLNGEEKTAWECLRKVITDFLGNHKSPEYETIVKDLLESFHRLGCRMSVKLHFFKHHLDYFPKNLGDYSEEQGERFHQDLKSFEKRYLGKRTENAMADYCWSLVRETDCRQNTNNHFPLY